jgi:hypothetical protein
MVRDRADAQRSPAPTIDPSELASSVLLARRASAHRVGRVFREAARAGSEIGSPAMRIQTTVETTFPFPLNRLALDQSTDTVSSVNLAGDHLHLDDRAEWQRCDA